MKELKIIRTNQENCVSCQRCISVCPVKFCNSSVGSFVVNDGELCVNCGLCMEACTHKARGYDDDLYRLLGDLKADKKVIGLVSPASYANFPGKCLKLNGFLKDIGIHSVFDLAGGADLMLKSYSEIIENSDNKLFISTVCPVTVSYISTYKPSLIPYLIETSSPAVHMLKMIREFFPEYDDYAILVVSPCTAGYDELNESGLGDYFVSFENLTGYLAERNILLDTYSEVPYDRLHSFSSANLTSPGGLPAELNRQFPGLIGKSRTLTGINQIISYFETFNPDRHPGEPGKPFLIDCLSCNSGCNGGSGTINKQTNPDILESYITGFNNKKLLHSENPAGPDRDVWRKGIYDLEYQDQSGAYTFEVPTDKELYYIYQTMYKLDDDDLVNCSSCGYNSCRNMAIAIHNNLNKVDNCFYFLDKQLTYISHYDQLTGLKNRNYLYEELENLLSVLKRSRFVQIKGMMIIDLDNFKDINETFGVDAGDEILVQVTRRLSSRLRASDFIYRIGGDEFAVIFNVLKNEEDVGIIARKLLDSFTEPFMAGKNSIHVEASIGISLFPRDSKEVAGLINNAETALTAAKSEKNTYRYYAKQMQERASKRVRMIKNLREAIKNEEFEVHYQPQLDLDGRILGAEALLRWRHPEMGMIPPSEFIPYAEDTGLIIPIGEWVISQSCSDFKKLEEMGLTDLTLSINISIQQFKDHSLTEKLEDILDRAGFDPGKLHLEITESSLMKDLNQTIKKLDTVSIRGTKVSLDDFGTGYSSLSYLNSLPLHILKIDKMFIDLIKEDTDKVQLVDTIISMAGGLGLDIVAEGIEHTHQIEYLRRFGCDIKIQGNYFSPPLPFDKLIEFARKSL